SRAYVNCPLCMPSRATLFTGMTPRGHRVRTNGIPLDRSTPTMPGALAVAGYKTASIGKIHLTNYWINANAQGIERTPQNFPEIHSFCNEGAIKQIPTPYFGLQHVDLTIGHGVNVGGNYALWLKNEHPKEWAKLQEKKVERSPLGAESCGASPLSEEFHHTAYVAEQTIKYLNAQNSKQPFYLMCSFPDPH